MQRRLVAASEAAYFRVPPLVRLPTTQLDTSGCMKRIPAARHSLAQWRRGGGGQ